MKRFDGSAMESTYRERRLALLFILVISLDAHKVLFPGALTKLFPGGRIVCAEEDRHESIGADALEEQSIRLRQDVATPAIRGERVGPHRRLHRWGTWDTWRRQ